MQTIKALVGAAIALLFAACSANAVQSTPDVPSAPAVHAAKAMRFLHEFTLPLGAYPSSVVAGSDGAMWFGKGVYDVAEGADGRVWFTNPYTYYTYTVGAIATNGAVTQYPVPGAGLPESIAADASKHLWYTAFGGSPDIVEIDTSGKTVATFKLKAGLADKVTYGESGRIWFNAVGPDHNIWFTEIQRNTDISKIGVLKP
ncbi:MAG TPA: hypothetical protein VFE35_08810 [Candidatus Cybelea sp.]|jgi:streptogramin lyase|nr:hypothetical protein [Candidatus Cybelea sp.]